MSDHIVSSFDDELKGLRRSIAEMGGLSEQLVEQAVTALLRADADIAKQVVVSDIAINKLHVEIEENAVLIIAKRQPVAQDLRETISAIRISSDLERVGDLGKNIARRTIASAGDRSVSMRLMTGVEHLSNLALRQLKRVLDAYSSRDTGEARRIWAGDQEIDAVYTSLFREMLTYMMEDPRNITMCTHLLFCAKNLERIGDHVTNIAETVYYLVEGEHLQEYDSETAA